MVNMFWLITIMGALFGGAILAVGFASANGAPQQAAAAALGIGCAVIPYCLARAISERADRRHADPARDNPLTSRSIPNDATPSREV